MDDTSVGPVGPVGHTVTVECNENDECTGRTGRTGETLEVSSDNEWDFDTGDWNFGWNEDNIHDEDMEDTYIDNIRIILGNDVKLLCRMDMEIRDNKELVLFALGMDGSLYTCISPRLKGDEDIVTLALNKDFTMYGHIPAKYKFQDKYLRIAVDGWLKYFNLDAVSGVDITIDDIKLIKNFRYYMVESKEYHIAIVNCVTKINKDINLCHKLGIEEPSVSMFILEMSLIVNGKK